MENTENPYYSPLLAGFFSNAIMLGFERRNMEISKIYLTGIEKVAEQPTNLYAKLNHKFFLGLLETNEDTRVQKINQIFSVLDILELPEKKAELQEFYISLTQKE